MKKFLFLTLIFGAVTSTAIHAQGSQQIAVQPAKEGTMAQSGDFAEMLKQAKEKQKPPMMEKTGLTDAQADRVIEINFEIRQKAGNLSDLSEDDRRAKLAELKELKDKKYSEIPLTAEQIKSVYAYYEGMRKNMTPKGGK